MRACNLPRLQRTDIAVAVTRSPSRVPRNFFGAAQEPSPVSIAHSGTPMGELMRRYWQPVLAGRNVTTRPREVRILGEDLIVFRDG